jgi:6-phosphogluconolactonase
MARVADDVRVFDDLASLSLAAAVEVVDICRRAISEHGIISVALSGGSTPARLYKLLARPPYREQINWTAVHVFWGDERCVPPDDPQNNYGQARDLLLDQVPVPAQNIHRVESELEPQQAAEDYLSVLKQHATPPLKWPRFDLVLLGMGEDGHTASLFPGSTVEAPLPALAVRGDYHDRPAWRVTLTPMVFNAAAVVLILVSGSGKSKTLADVLYGPYRPEALPAQRIRPANGRLIWMLDRGAAAALPGTVMKE